MRATDGEASFSFSSLVLGNLSPHSAFGIPHSAFESRAGQRRMISPDSVGASCPAIASDQPLAVWGKEEGPQRTAQMSKGHQLLLGGEVPHFHGAVIAAAGQSFAVGGERNRPHILL